MDPKGQIPPDLPLLKGGIPLSGIFFLFLDKQRGVTCLREAPPSRALCGGQALRRRQGGDFQKMSLKLWTL
jgi:hypothetical protein